MISSTWETRSVRCPKLSEQGSFPAVSQTVRTGFFSISCQVGTSPSRPAPFRMHRNTSPCHGIKRKGNSLPDLLLDSDSWPLCQEAMIRCAKGSSIVSPVTGDWSNAASPRNASIKIAHHGVEGVDASKGRAGGSSRKIHREWGAVDACASTSREMRGGSDLFRIACPKHRQPHLAPPSWPVRTSEPQLLHNERRCLSFVVV
jgi:hypothetical protein